MLRRKVFQNWNFRVTKFLEALVALFERINRLGDLVVDSNACKDSSTQTVEITTVSIGPSSRSSYFEAEVYPNPVKDFLSIDLKLEQPREVEISLVDMSGRETASLMEKTTMEPGNHHLEKSLNSHQIPAGTQILQISYDDNVKYFQLQFLE